MNFKTIIPLIDNSKLRIYLELCHKFIKNLKKSIDVNLKSELKEILNFNLQAISNSASPSDSKSRALSLLTNTKYNIQRMREEVDSELKKID